MPQKALALLLSLLLAAGPSAPAFAAEPLLERLKAARETLKGHLAAGTLTRADYAALEKQYQELKAPVDPNVKTAWDAFQPPAHRYNELRRDLLDLDPAKLSQNVRALSKELGLPADKEDTLVLRYAQVRSTLLENGVKSKAGVFVDKDEQPLSDEALAALVAKAPVISAQQQESAAADLAALAGVKESIGKKDYAGAVKKLNKVLEGMADRPELNEAAFGSLPMQQTLAEIQEARKDLPGAWREKVDKKKLDSLDQQLLAVMKAKIEVPDIPGKELKPEEHGESPFRVGVQLAFYAALTGFPMVSGWAAKRLYQLAGTEALRGDPNVKSFRFTDLDPSGKFNPGFFITYKSGDAVYEGRDGSKVHWNKDRTARIEQNQAAGTYKLVKIEGTGASAKEVEVIGWERDKAGITRGKFHGRAFELAKDEALMLVDDNKRLVIFKGTDPKNPKLPNILRWLDSEGQRGKVYPDGLGEWMSHKSKGPDGKDAWYKDILLEPAALKKAVDGKLDLSALKGDLDEARIAMFQRFLNDFSQFGLLFKHSLAGTSEKNPKGQLRTNSVMQALIRDGMMTLTLGTQYDEPNKKGKMEADYTVSADVEPDGKMKVFLQSDRTVFMWVFDSGMTTCDQFRTDAEADLEGRTAWIFSRRYERKGQTWELTKSQPISLKEWTTTDTLKAVGSGTLQGLGHAGEIIFSPVQSAHHVIHSGLVSGMARASDATGLTDGVTHFADVDGVYTRRQATFAKWAGAGLESPGEITSAWNDALAAAGTKDRQQELRSFLDSEVEKFRKERYGELWRFHKNDPISEEDRAYAAGRVFGLSNLAQNYFDAGKESFAQGNKISGIGSYAVGAFAAGGQMYVQGFGFGAMAQGVKTLAVGAKYGLKASQVAAAMQRAAQLERGLAVPALTAAERAAVGLMTKIGRGEMAMFVTPGVIQVSESAYHGIAAWRTGDDKQAVKHMDEFIHGASMFAVPLAINAGHAFTTNLVSRVGGMRSTNPINVEKGKQKLIEELKLEKPELAKEVKKTFETDSMTGMNNRSWLMSNASKLLAKLEKPLVAILDMNNFGAVNEGLVALFGPSAGKVMADTMLFKAGQRLKSLAEQTGVEIARFGGEEFAVIGEHAAVVKFTEAAKLEFKNNQALNDAGFTAGSKELKAIQEAATKKGRGDQSIGDWTFGLASAKGRTFDQAWHAADLALNAGKKAEGGRGNAFMEIQGEGGKVKYEKVTEGVLEGEALIAAQQEKALRDAELPSLKQPDVDVELAALREKLGQEKFEKFEKAAHVDSLTQTREYDYVKAKAVEWGERYKKGGQAALISARGLKLINDALGHEAGDRFLKAFGRELRKAGLEAREKGNWIEDVTRVASKDFMIVGMKTGSVAKAVESAMKKVMESSEVLSKADRAKVKELAKNRNELSSEAGSLRIVETEMVQDTAAGRADIFKTLDALIAKSEALKQKEQPAPPPPPKVSSK